MHVRVLALRVDLSRCRVSWAREPPFWGFSAQPLALSCGTQVHSDGLFILLRTISLFGCNGFGFWWLLAQSWCFSTFSLFLTLLAIPISGRLLHLVTSNQLRNGTRGLLSMFLMLSILSLHVFACISVLGAIGPFLLFFVFLSPVCAFRVLHSFSFDVFVHNL